MTRAALVALSAGALAAAFWAGRRTAPRTVAETHQRVQEAAKADTKGTTAAASESRTQAAEVASADVVQVVTRPSGESVRTVWKTRVETQRVVEYRDRAVAAAETHAEASRVAVVETRTIAVPAPLPAWSVSALAGYVDAPVVGLSVSRTILGPVSVGAWGVAGLSGSLRGGGVSVGLAF